MKRELAFWDASGLVPLLVRESGSRQSRALLRKFAPVVWWGSLVEIRSAVSRSVREGAMGQDEARIAVGRLEQLRASWREVVPTEPVRELAIQLVEAHPLRAADCLQLAAALTWCRQHPARRAFVTGDQRLSEAAQAQGFEVIDVAGRRG